MTKKARVAGKLAMDERLARLKRADKTRSTYATVIDLIPADADPIEWLYERLADAPIGTVLPFRAAVKHFLIAMGMSEAEIDATLPPARGKPGRRRIALGPTQLATYYEAVDALAEGSVRTLLSILPRTGLRISEAVKLRWTDRNVQDDADGFTVRGKRDKVRFVPLTPGIALKLDAWSDWLHGDHTGRYAEAADSGWVFPGYKGGHLDESAVRHATLGIRKGYRERTGKGDLDALSPHVLRHTFATNAIKHMDVRGLQEVAGWESLATAGRYLHPRVSEIANALAHLDDV